MANTLMNHAITKRNVFKILLSTALLINIFCLKSFAGPPFFTDDPEPVEPGDWEIYLASQLTKDKVGWSGSPSQVEINYGAYPDLQLHVILPTAFNHPDNEGQSIGYGDTEFGAKYRFVHETNDIPQIGTFVLVEAPTGNANQNLGNGTAQAFIPLWMQKSWGPWTTYGGGGYWINPGDGNLNWGYIGWLLQRNISEHLTLGSEIFHRTPDIVNGDSGTGFTVGGQININDTSHFLFSFGRDFVGPNVFTYYVALLWTI